MAKDLKEQKEEIVKNRSDNWSDHLLKSVNVERSQGWNIEHSPLCEHGTFSMVRKGNIVHCENS